MVNRKIHILIFVCSLSVLLLSCAYPKNFSYNFYRDNENTLVTLKDRFKKIYSTQSFSILFEEKKFAQIAFEHITDTAKYIYRFNINQPSTKISLEALGFDGTEMMEFIHDLKKVGCTWITNLDYYENYEKRYLVLMAVRNKALNKKFKGESYCTLAFFEKSQPFDDKGRFLDRSEKKRKRQINGSYLYRLNDKVGFAITRHYR